MTDEGTRLMRLWGKGGESGHIKIKAVKCKKKNCRSCPHSWYAYFVTSFYGEKYLGTCDIKGNPRTRYTSL